MGRWEMRRLRGGEVERWIGGEMERWQDGDMERWRVGGDERNLSVAEHCFIPGKPGHVIVTHGR